MHLNCCISYVRRTMTIIDSSVHSSLEPRKVVALLILWVVLSAAAAIAVSIASPHGMAAFVITSVVLGLLGGIVHVILYAWLLQTERMKMSYQLALISGLLCGRACVETAPIGIEAPSKRQIRTLIPAQNVTGRIFKHLQLHMGSRL